MAPRDFNLLNIHVHKSDLRTIIFYHRGTETKSSTIFFTSLGDLSIIELRGKDS